MLDLSWYEGREQTYIKHKVLERYLQKLAYKKGWYGGTLNYVDCFAGPWQHANEDLEDTSPFIAIKELQKARDRLIELARPSLAIRCLFIEKDLDACQLLKRKLRTVQDIDVQAINGEFEDQIESIWRSLDGAFTFFFIDPTGWTGYALNVIAPLLQHEGEVLINFMTQFIVRFIDNDRPEDIESFNNLFGSRAQEYRTHWAGLSGLDREEAIVRAYCERVREVGDFSYVAPTIILDPISDRSHFHLIYATRHIEGLRVFRNDAEKPAGDEQRQARFAAQSRRRSENTGQMGLFDEPFGRSYSDELRERYHRKAHDRLKKLLHQKRRVRFDDLEAEALLFPWMSTQDLKDWLVDQKNQGALAFEGLGSRGRVPQADKDHWIVIKGAEPGVR